MGSDPYISVEVKDNSGTVIKTIRKPLQSGISSTEYNTNLLKSLKEVQSEANTFLTKMIDDNKPDNNATATAKQGDNSGDEDNEDEPSDAPKRLKCSPSSPKKRQKSGS